MNRQQYADLVLSQFSERRRDDGSRFFAADDNTEAKALAQHVHFDVFDGIIRQPSDWVWEKTRDIVALYADDDNAYESASELADTAYRDLVAWLGDNVIFSGFASDAMRFKNPENIWDAIAYGQADALRQMEHSIGEWLTEHAPMATRYLVQHATSGDVYVTDGANYSDALDYREWRQPDGYDLLDTLDLFAVELSPENGWDDAPDWHTIAEQQYGRRPVRIDR